MILRWYIQKVYHLFFCLWSSYNKFAMKKYIFLFLLPLLITGCNTPSDPEPLIPPEPEVVHVSSVSLTTPDVTLFKVDAIITLNTTVLPADADNKAVTYSVDDETTAKIDVNGTVTCLKEGEVTFTVTSVDGAKTGQLTLTILPKEEPTPSKEEREDFITYDVIGLNSGFQYKDYEFEGPETDITYVANAMYNKGTQSGGVDEPVIQIRSKSEDSGIIVTCSDCTCKSIEIVWSDLTDTGWAQLDRFLDVYGSNEPYEYVSDLYDTTKCGTLLASLKYDSDTAYSFTTDYQYIGLRSQDGAVYLKSIDIIWYHSI